MRRQNETLDLVLWVLVLVLLGLVTGFTPWSCEAQAPEPGPQPGLVVLEHNGAPGVWFPLEEARAAVLALGDAQSYRDQLRLVRESLHLADAQVAVLAARGRELEALLTGAQAALDTARAEAEAQGAWWRSPWFWGVLGLLVGAGGVLALAVAL